MSEKTKRKAMRELIIDLKSQGRHGSENQDQMATRKIRERVRAADAIEAMATELEALRASRGRMDKAAMHEKIMQEMWASEDEEGQLHDSARLGEFQRLAHAAIRALQPAEDCGEMR